MTEQIQKAVQVLASGGVIIYPTDTAFGIGCRIDMPETIDRLFHLRKRPPMQAMPVLVSSIDMALSYFDAPSNVVRHLMSQHWPGGLTIVAPCKKNLIYSPIRGHGDSVGLRMPNHQTALSIITGAGVPLIGTSANFHGASTPYTRDDLDPKLIELVDYVVDGVCSSEHIASTVVDCSVDPYKIIRQGAVLV